MYYVDSKQAKTKWKHQMKAKKEIITSNITCNNNSNHKQKMQSYSHACKVYYTQAQVISKKTKLIISSFI